MKHRGGKGVTCHNITEKTGFLTAIAAVCEEDDLMMITNDGTIIRIPVSGIPTYSRSAGGVIVMRLSAGASIVNIARLESQEALEEEIRRDEENQSELALPDPDSEKQREYTEAEEKEADVEHDEEE
jgi:DNA gyrase subunit A